MFELKTDNGAIKAEVTFYTALVYESEFQSDLIADMFGIQRLDSGEFSYEDGVLTGIDFTKIGWAQVTKALWAAVKTADDGAPRYDRWMRDMRGANLWEARNDLIDEISDCFFRSEAADEEAAEQS